MGLSPDHPCYFRIFREINHPAIAIPPFVESHIPPHIFPKMSRLAGEGPVSTHFHCYMPKSSPRPSRHLPAPSSFVKGMNLVKFATFPGPTVGLLFVVHYPWWNDEFQSIIHDSPERRRTEDWSWTNHSSTMGITISEPTRRALGTSTAQLLLSNWVAGGVGFKIRDPQIGVDPCLSCFLKQGSSLINVFSRFLTFSQIFSVL